MNEPAPTPRSHRVEWLVWSALAATVLFIAIAFVRSRLQDGGLHRNLDVVGEVPDFSLTNQFSKVVSRSNLLGQVWVVDVIFTRCPMSCEQMTRRMHALEKDLPARLSMKFVSLTADPERDTPDVLRQYAERHGVDQSRWDFLTGIKRDVYAL